MLLTRRKYSLIFILFQLLVLVASFVGLVLNPVVDIESCIYNGALILISLLLVLLWTTKKNIRIIAETGEEDQINYDIQRTESFTEFDFKEIVLNEKDERKSL